MLEFIDLEVDGKKEITITLSFNGKIIKKSLEPKKFRPENRNIIMDGIAETVGIKTPKEIGMHFSFLPGETSVVITCEKGNGSFSKGTKGVGSSNHLDYDDLWACAFAFTDWINNKYLSN